MYGIQVEQDINCRTFGRCVHGSDIDREMGTLVLPAEAPDRGRFFRYVRYNADLSRDGLNCLGLNEIDPASVQKMDAVDQIENLVRVGRAVAEKEVAIEHFGPFV